jgi:glycosyltransferase involved in cell wall biosynthesis
MRVVIAHDWLDAWGGGEAVLAELLGMFPGADVYTLVDFMSERDRAKLRAGRIVTSSVQRLPGARRWFRGAAVLCPRVVERFDLSRYDLVVSDSHAIAKGVRKRTGAAHIAYCHTPARFAWTMTTLYAERASRGRRMLRPLADAALARFRRWDAAVTRRVDALVANSQHIADAILRSYGRRAEVVYPPVDVERFALAPTARSDRYVTVGRLVPYKRVDLLIEAFRRRPERRLLVIGDGPERTRLAALAPRNVELAGTVDDADVARHLSTARAFVYAAEEDFGIAMAEAQAAGAPVIAFAKGGAREIVRDLDDANPTGVLFSTQTVEAIGSALDRFEAAPAMISEAACRENARRFAREHFRFAFGACVDRTMQATRGGR